MYNCNDKDKRVFKENLLLLLWLLLLKKRKMLEKNKKKRSWFFFFVCCLYYSEKSWINVLLYMKECIYFNLYKINKLTKKKYTEYFLLKLSRVLTFTCYVMNASISHGSSRDNARLSHKHQVYLHTHIVVPTK